MRRVHGERGDIIVGWLTKITVFLALTGVLGFDLVSVATTKMSAADDAQNAARKAADVYQDTKDVQTAYTAALDYVEERNGAIDPADFLVERDGTVRVTVQKTATTVVFYRTSKSKKWTLVKAEGSGKAP